ncbi:MAG: hypothetical protein J0I29_12370 [Rhizobiales bacterium]|nr:hypothetical protein [Hyphomicrobiales bacterium]
MACTLCHSGANVIFDVTRTQSDDRTWRITANPLAWGNIEPEILVMWFSKGPSQAGALSTVPHDDIPYRKGRKQVGKILAHVGLLPQVEPDELKLLVDHLIADRHGRFGWGSLIRCTVERLDSKSAKWLGSGGMIDEFMATTFGQRISQNCAGRFLRNLPSRTKLVIMFGLGARGSYVAAARKAIEAARPGKWSTVNDVAYSDGKITVVHVEHFASQGANIPNWLGQRSHPRARLGTLAREAVSAALGRE